MSKKNKFMDAGLAYMKKIGLRPESSRNVAYDKLRSVADNYQVNNLIDILDIARGFKEGSFSRSDLYTAKNATLDLSLALSSTFRADIYRKICNWIVSHKDLFGSCILDLGCDCGIMTCFLAQQFPKSHVIGIDVTSVAIENAKQLAVKLNVNNVEFICVDAFSFNQPVDTVFSMLVMHELYDDVDENCRDKTFNDIAKYWTSGFDRIVSHICEILSNGGNLISIDNDNNFLSIYAPGCLSFMYSLYHHGLSMISFDFVPVKELDSAHHMQCMVIGFDSTTDVDKISDDLIFDKYVYDVVSQMCDLNESEYFDFGAKLMRDVYCGELLRGFYIREKSGEYSEYSVWRDKKDSQYIIFFRTEGVEKFTRFKKDNLVDICSFIDSVYKNKSSGVGCTIVWKKMD